MGVSSNMYKDGTSQVGASFISLGKSIFVGTVLQYMQWKVDILLYPVTIVFIDHIKGWPNNNFDIRSVGHMTCYIQSVGHVTDRWPVLSSPLFNVCLTCIFNELMYDWRYVWVCVCMSVFCLRGGCIFLCCVSCISLFLPIWSG